MYLSAPYVCCHPGCPPPPLFNHPPHPARPAGELFAIGTLDRDRCPQFSIDLTLASDQVTIHHTGASNVFVTGYKTVAAMAYGDDSDDEEYRSEFLLLLASFLPDASRAAGRTALLHL